jgi:uncharacterized protein (DUF1778 family)
VTGEAGRGRDRRHLLPGRRRQLFVRCTEQEYADIAAAARAAGLTPTGYAAEAALAAARGAIPPRAEPWREVLKELMDARAQVRRFGANVNQAVRVLHVSGEPPEALARAIAVTTRSVERLDQAAAELVRRLR